MDRAHDFGVGKVHEQHAGSHDVSERGSCLVRGRVDDRGRLAGAPRRAVLLAASDPVWDAARHRRAVVGMMVTLQAASATLVELCLAHMATEKRVRLEDLGARVSWPMAGEPAEFYVENSAELHSEALRRGC